MCGRLNCFSLSIWSHIKPDGHKSYKISFGYNTEALVIFRLFIHSSMYFHSLFLLVILCLSHQSFSVSWDWFIYLSMTLSMPIGLLTICLVSYIGTDWWSQSSWNSSNCWRGWCPSWVLSVPKSIGKPTNWWGNRRGTSGRKHYDSNSGGGAAREIVSWGDLWPISKASRTQTVSLFFLWRSQT